jgi:hypothetical protein
MGGILAECKYEQDSAMPGYGPMQTSYNVNLPQLDDLISLLLTEKEVAIVFHVCAVGRHGRLPRCRSKC